MGVSPISGDKDWYLKTLLYALGQFQIVGYPLVCWGLAFKCIVVLITPIHPFSFTSGSVNENPGCVCVHVQVQNLKVSFKPFLYTELVLSSSSLQGTRVLCGLHEWRNHMLHVCFRIFNNITWYRACLWQGHDIKYSVIVVAWMHLVQTPSMHPWTISYFICFMLVILFIFCKYSFELKYIILHGHVYDLQMIIFC